MANPIRFPDDNINSIYENFLKAVEFEKPRPSSPTDSINSLSSLEKAAEAFTSRGGLSPRSLRHPKILAHKDDTLKKDFSSKFDLLSKRKEVNTAFLEALTQLDLKEDSKLIDIAKDPKKAHELITKLTHLNEQLNKNNANDKRLFSSLIKNLKDLLSSLDPESNNTVDVFLIEPLKELNGVTNNQIAKDLEAQLAKTDLSKKKLGELNEADIEKVKNIFDAVFKKAEQPQVNQIVSPPSPPEEEDDFVLIDAPKDVSKKELQQAKQELLKILMTDETVQQELHPQKIKNSYSFSFTEAGLNFAKEKHLEPDSKTAGITPATEHSYPTQFKKDYDTNRSSHYHLTFNLKKQKKAFTPKDLQENSFHIVHLATLLANEITSSKEDESQILKIRNYILYLCTQKIPTVFMDPIKTALSLALAFSEHMNEKLSMKDITSIEIEHESLKTPDGKINHNHIKTSFNMQAPIVYSPQGKRDYGSSNTQKQFNDEFNIGLVTVKGHFILEINPTLIEGRIGSIKELKYDARLELL